MSRVFRVFLLSLFLLSFVVDAQTPQQPKPVAASPNPRLVTVQLQSRLTGKTLPYNVLLPVDYEQPNARSKNYPVLYLLHGLFGRYDNWTRRTKLPEYSANYSMIIVTPEGHNGWYTNSATVTSDKYETYIIEELIPDVQSRFRTLTTREGRAIAGLSMGGYGALKFGVKYPEKFVFAGSMSGAIAAASWTDSELRGMEVILRALKPVFGDEGSETRAGNDLLKLFRELSGEKVSALPFIYFDCGTEDPLLKSNQTLAQLLVEKKITHEYRQLPGAHSWAYWDTQVQEVMRQAARRFTVTQTVSLRSFPSKVSRPQSAKYRFALQ